MKNDGKRFMYKEREMDIKKVCEQSDKQVRNRMYNEYVDRVTPNHSVAKKLVRAFISGGLTCLLGQALLAIYMYFGMDKETAALYETLSLIAISVLLTGFGLFAKIAKFAGAGVIVPITGFANSVASPAIEFKKEGQIYGIGCKIFTIAGPVILYGIFTSSVLGFIYWLVENCQTIGAI